MREGGMQPSGSSGRLVRQVERLGDGLVADLAARHVEARWRGADPAFIAASAPRLAIFSANGRVALLSANAEVRATAPGMLATQ